MKTWLINLLNLFIAFLLANVVSKYVTNWIDNHLKKSKNKKLYDEEMAKIILSCFPKSEFRYFLSNISNGILPQYQHELWVYLREISSEHKFFNRKLRRNFNNFIKSMDKLMDFVAEHFFLLQNGKVFKFYPDYLEKEIYEEKQKLFTQTIPPLIKEIEARYEKMYNTLRKFFPHIVKEHLSQSPRR